MKNYFVVAVVAFIFLISCAFSNISIFSIDDYPMHKVDERLLGKWKLLEDTTGQSFFTVRMDGEYQYKISGRVNAGGNNYLNQSTAFVSEIGSVQFLNITCNYNNIKGYVFLKLADIDTIQKTVTAFMISDSTLNTIESRQELKDIITANINNPGFYNKGLHFRLAE